MDFGKYTEYMVIGYAALFIILGAMIAWIVWRYRMLIRERALIEQFEAEERAERAAAVAAKASLALDPSATPIMRDFSAPNLREKT